MPIVELIGLTLMEIVLGIDNIVFIAILTSRLPKEQQSTARRTGLAAALISRILLLFVLTTIMKLTRPLFSLDQLGLATDWLAQHPETNEVSWRDLILGAGGLFLIGKSVLEIHEQTAGDHHGMKKVKQLGFWNAIAQIAALDIVFSLDSVMTAIGMVDPGRLWVMVTSVIIAVGVMLIFANRVSNFVEENPTVKMLALSFLILIGVVLVADAIGTHIDKGYIYFAMAFSLIVEMLNLRVRGKKPAPAA